MEKSGAIPAFADEARLRRTLRRNRALATGILGVAALVFIGTSAVPEPGFWIALVRAGAEAALVGGLADWFAVTALFRHPLGLPIPRTAVIPKNKDRIGEGLGQFVERNFLAPEILAAKLAVLEPVERVARWLAAPDHARAAAQGICDALPPLVRSLEDPELRSFVARSLHEQLREAELAPALGRMLAILTRSAPYDALFDRALDAARDALADNTGRIYALVAERSRWWIPRSIDRRVAEQIVGGIEEILAELRDKESAARASFRAAVAHATDELVHSPDWRRRVAELKETVLEQKEVQDWLAAVWDELRRIVVEDLESPRSRTREAIAAGLQSLGHTLAADPAMRQRIHGAVEHVALAVVPWRGQISALIAEVVRTWDADTVAARLELAMGSDLQYIRMNGTLVGACVGCLLFLITRFLFW
ncbi:MAG TPA: DUF445 domain-containing protein [Stellaceae bacterium]|nr:DUF445 domain-containing protein [Stellaceae bacterium]